MIEPFPFIVGSGRSGTTLLRAVLAAHPTMSVPPESYVLERLLGVRGQLEHGGALDRGALVDELYADSRFLRWELPQEAVVAELERRAPQDLAGGVRAVYAAYARREGRTRWADKTPIYVLLMPQIAALLPEAVFIHLVRDGRDVTTSYRQLPWGPSTTVGAAARWRRHVLAGRRAGRVLGPSRYLEVRYEDLVADPGAEVARICDLCGLDFDPAMLDHRQRASELLSNTAHRHFVSGMTQPLSAGRRDWRRELSERDQAVIGAIAGDALWAAGYPPGPSLDPARRQLVELGGRAVGLGQSGVEHAKRSRLAIVARPTVRRLKRVLGRPLD